MWSALVAFCQLLKGIERELAEGGTEAEKEGVGEIGLGGAGRGVEGATRQGSAPAPAEARVLGLSGLLAPSGFVAIFPSP
jgi:hypothetical protein